MNDQIFNKDGTRVKTNQALCPAQVLDLTTTDSSHSPIVAFDGYDRRARPFNLLRTSVAKKLAENDARMVGITSATPDAGKSFLSVNLAAGLAQVSDVPVCLVDLDLRRASIAEYLGIKVEKGIGDYLEDESVTLNDIGVTIVDQNMMVFPTKPVTRNSAELLAGHRFRQMVEEMRRVTDKAVVIFDLPPVFANDDAMISIQQLDGYLMVVDAGKTTKRQVIDVLTMLSPTPCYGSILNRYNSLIDSYGYGSAVYDRYYTNK